MIQILGANFVDGLDRCTRNFSRILLDAVGIDYFPENWVMVGHFVIEVYDMTLPDVCEPVRT